MTRTRPAAELLALPVRLHGIELGSPIDLVVDTAPLRAVGFEVACGDGVHRFLPLAAARLHDEELAVASPLMLLEERDLAFYRTRTRTLATLRGRPVEQGPRTLGTLVDAVVADDGTIVELVVGRDGTTARVPLDERVRIREPERSTAA